MISVLQPMRALNSSPGISKKAAEVGSIMTQNRIKVKEN
jgi:hypothetical protein